MSTKNVTTATEHLPTSIDSIISGIWLTTMYWSANEPTHNSSFVRKITISIKIAMISRFVLYQTDIQKPRCMKQSRAIKISWIFIDKKIIKMTNKSTTEICQYSKLNKSKFYIKKSIDIRSFDQPIQ